MLGEGGAGAADVQAIPIPTSLQALIGSRLDSLAAPEKRTAQQASVLGSVFWPGALVYAGNGEAMDVPQLTESLGGLERRDFVFQRDTSVVVGEDEWAFKHILIRDVAYGRLPKQRRITLHTRVADLTAGLPGGDELVEIVAYHLEQACRLAREVARTPEPPPVLRAIDALIRAAERAEAREEFARPTASTREHWKSSAPSRPTRRWSCVSGVAVSRPGSATSPRRRRPCRTSSTTRAKSLGRMSRAAGTCC